jgi:hypothetical protein
MPTKFLKYEFLVQAIKYHRTPAECLLWPYGASRGYGVVRTPNGVFKVHRLAFFLANGQWPKPCGRHICDTPLCFNPRHIIEGTQLANVKDMVARGRARGAVGVRNSHASLTPEAVAAIRATYVPWVTTKKQLAEQWGVSEGCIKHIVNRTHWK